MIRYLHRLFLEIGREISGIWIFATAIVIWISFPSAILFGSLVASYWVAKWLEVGNLLVFVIAIPIAIFLLAYVWLPYVRPAADRAAKALLENP